MKRSDESSNKMARRRRHIINNLMITLRNLDS